MEVSDFPRCATLTILNVNLVPIHFIDLYRNVPERTGMYQNVPECTGMYRNVPECTRMYRNVPECTVSYSCINLGFNSLYAEDPPVGTGSRSVIKYS